MGVSDNNDAVALVGRAAAGDPRAQRKLVDNLHRRVQSIALSILGNALDAEACSQVILMEILRGLASFRGESVHDTFEGGSSGPRTLSSPRGHTLPQPAGLPTCRSAGELPQFAPGQPRGQPSIGCRPHHLEFARGDQQRPAGVAASTRRP